MAEKITREDAREFLRRPEADEFQFDARKALSEKGNVGNNSSASRDDSDERPPTKAKKKKATTTSELDSVRMYLSRIGCVDLLTR